MRPGGRRRIPVRINRRAPKAALVPFTEHFKGFEKVGAVRSVFKDETEEVLEGLKIGFIPNRGMYMGIRDNDGNLAVGTYHLRNSPTRTLYLDIVHELVHINQRRTNEKWFHDEFMKFMRDRSLYYASPIEVEAYRHTVREAERIGMTPDEILEYLKIGDPPAKTWKRFVKEMGLGKAPVRKRITDFPVKINRKTTSTLLPFSDYFIGFEKVPSVADMFGDSTDKVLGEAKVEFIDSPFPSIYPSEEDGHLVVASQYFKTGSLTSLYLDAFLCLHMIKSFSESKLAAESGDDVWESPGMQRSYAAMVAEARRLGVKDEEILPHLRLASFMMSRSGYKRFLKSLGVKERTDPSKSSEIGNRGSKRSRTP